MTHYDAIGQQYDQYRHPDPRLSASIGLESGAWDRRHGELGAARALDVGYRLIVANEGARLGAARSWGMQACFWSKSGAWSAA